MIVKPVIHAAFVLFCLTQIFLSDAEAASVKYGLWEITTTTKMENMPVPVEIPPQTMKQCINKSQLVPKTKNVGGGCTYKQSNAAGGRIKWTVSCPQGAKGSGFVEYKGGSMQGQSKLVINSGGQKMITHGDIRGKYIGPCDR